MYIPTSYIHKFWHFSFCEKVFQGKLKYSLKIIHQRVNKHVYVHIKGATSKKQRIYWYESTQETDVII